MEIAWRARDRAQLTPSAATARGVVAAVPVDATWLNEDLGDQAEERSTLLRVTLDNVGASFNHIFDSQWTARAHHEFTSSGSVTSHPPPGVPSAPYAPRHSLLFGATWASLSERLIVGGEFSYRSLYHVALPYVHSLEPLEGDWVANLRGAWLLPNKRWSAEVRRRNLFAQESPFTYARLLATCGSATSSSVHLSRRYPVSRRSDHPRRNRHGFELFRAVAATTSSGFRG